MTPREKAERAKQLLDDPVVRGVFEDIRMGLVSQLEKVPFGDIDTQHNVAISLQLLKNLRDTIKKYADEGLIQEHNNKQQTFMDRIRQRITDIP